MILTRGAASISEFSFDSEQHGWLSGLVYALFVSLQFVIVWSYYTLFEYLWNGQTPGKRLVRIRGLRLDGNPIGFTGAVLRNLASPVDFLPTGYGLGLIVTFCNEKIRRLGELGQRARSLCV